jgi:hypothetical protein
MKKAGSLDDYERREWLADRIWDEAFRVLEEFAAGAGGEGRKRR